MSDPVPAAPTRTSPVARYPVHPLLFAAYAVLFLYSENLIQVLLVDAVAPLATALVGTSAVFAVAAVLLRSARRGALVASAIVFAWYGFGRVAETLTGAGLEERAQLILWAVGLAVVIVYAIRARSSLPTVTAALNTVAAVLVALTLVTIIPFEASRAARAAPIIDTGLVSATTSMPRRDVYFIVFDRYGSQAAIQTRFGISDGGLHDWLEARGFQVQEGSHANYRATDFSLAATLNMTYLDHLTETVGRVADDRTPAQAMIRDHAVGRQFQALGYRYIHMGSWFDPTSFNPGADENLTYGVTNEFESVLRDTTVLPALERLRGGEVAAPTFRERHRETTLFEFRQLERLATAPGPKFVFAHILMPHDPYVFQADGSVLVDESVITDEAKLYGDHLTYLNSRIRGLVETLTAGPDEEDPIIILQGDEGPLACRNVDCVQDDDRYFAIRFGNLNAMYLPGVDAVVPPDITSVNTFPFVFRHAFGLDVDLLPDRSFTWPDNEHIYDFRDITDRLP